MDKYTPNPFLSIVIAVRNDNYGGDFNGRLQLSVHWLAQLTQKYQLQTELVLVNYNPVPDRDGLDKSIQWPTERDYLRIRIITVPEAVHLHFVQPNVRKTVPLFEFIAKNIGIRRAKGQFILCTNADILFSESFIKFLATRQLEKGVLYRCDRFDFRLPEKDRQTPALPLDQLEQRLRSGVFRFYLQGGNYKLHFPSSLSIRVAILRRYNGLRRRFYSVVRNILPTIRSTFFLFQYHCHASGDMALLDRDSWYQLRGYLEDTWISTHTDALHTVGAGVSGLPIVVLPFPVYHQHHERRYNFDRNDPDINRMFRRLLNDVQTMLHRGKATLNAGDDWGMPHQALEEQTI